MQDLRQHFQGARMQGRGGERREGSVCLVARVCCFLFLGSPSFQVLVKRREVFSSCADVREGSVWLLVCTYCFSFWVYRLQILVKRREGMGLLVRALFFW